MTPRDLTCFKGRGSGQHFRHPVFHQETGLLYTRWQIIQMTGPKFKRNCQKCQKCWTNTPSELLKNSILKNTTLPSFQVVFLTNFYDEFLFVSRQNLKWVRRCVMQVAFVRPFSLFIALVLWTDGKYQPGIVRTYSRWGNVFKWQYLITNKAAIVYCVNWMAN